MKHAISIIVPSFKKIEKLKRLLHSIGIHNTVETIVVNDDKKGSLYTLQESFPHIIFLDNECLRGAGGARNTGLKACTGKYILFADADDIFMPNWFMNVSDFISNNKRDIVFFPPESFIEGCPDMVSYRTKKYKNLIKNYNENKSLDILYYFFPPWSKLINRDLIFGNNILFEEIIASNDINFSLKLGLNAKNISISNKVIYSVEKSDNSMTSLRNIEVICCRLDALFRYNDILISNNLRSKTLMMLPWLYRLFICSPVQGVSYLFKGIARRTPVVIDHRFKRWFLCQ